MFTLLSSLEEVSFEKQLLLLRFGQMLSTNACSTAELFVYYGVIVNGLRCCFKQFSSKKNYIFFL